MPSTGCAVERRVPILVLKINVAASFNQLLRDGGMSFFGSDAESRDPIVLLKINVTASLNQLFRDDLMPFLCCHVEQ
jgi:hypothetical protein